MLPKQIPSGCPSVPLQSPGWKTKKQTADSRIVTAANDPSSSDAYLREGIKIRSKMIPPTIKHTYARK